MPVLRARLNQTGHIVAISGDWRQMLVEELHGASNPTGRLFRSLKAIEPVASEAHLYFAGLDNVICGKALEFHRFYRSEVKGEERWYKSDAFYLRDNHVTVSVQDVGSIHLTKGAVDEMYRRLSRAKEEERERIAIELHDSTSQHLAAIGLNLMTLRQHLSSGNVQSILADIESSLEIVQKELRSINYLMFPFELEKEGLSSALLSLANGFTRRTGLAVRMNVQETVDGLPFSMKKALFRIVQEAISNACRHSKANVALVKLVARRNVVGCRIVDDGIGMRSQASLSSTGVGIPGMIARARQFGGVVRVRSGLHGGTTVSVMIPMAQARRSKSRINSPMIRGLDAAESGFFTI
jgi:two-component system, NarL family, sensor kinase